MNRDETAELFLKGREAWNAWAEARLAERKALEERGAWKSYREKSWQREKGEKPETQGWLDKAFTDFSRCLFLVRGAEGIEETAEGNNKEGADSGTPVKLIQLEADRIDFAGFIFPSDAWFGSATFTSAAWFTGATFTGNAWFESATFISTASLRNATFTGKASFRSATFTRTAWFGSATFTGDASFRSAAFIGDARFDRSNFTSNARFYRAAFTGNARFNRATFTGNARFDRATFTGDARFDRAIFTRDAYLPETQFKRDATFDLASFKQHAKFASSRFEASASFYAIHGERGFDMAGAVFEAVPDFIQAHFEEAPRLDNLKVSERWIERHPWPERKAPKEQAEKEELEEELEEEQEEERQEEPESKWRQRWYAARHFGGRARTWPARVAKGAWRRARYDNSDIPARWRALKRLAIQGHDIERELEYHARELKSLRFEDDWPLPFKFWRAMAWAGFFRFWFGIFYGVFSVYGRSLFRPALLWLATVAVFAMYFLSGQPDVLERRRAAEPQGFGGSVVAYVKTIPSLWSNPPPCYAGVKGKDGQPSELTGLVEPVIGSTNALREAIRLAFRNGSVILDGGEDAVHRTYGCLYGIERYGGNPVPFVPGFANDASGIQKVLSALYIFLFGLALRNMLKMK